MTSQITLNNVVLDGLHFRDVSRGSVFEDPVDRHLVINVVCIKSAFKQ